MSNGVSYTVAVKSQPDDSICTITNGTGAISNANVSNVSITCVTTTAVTLSFSSPASNALIPLDDVATVTLAFTNTEADHLTWTIVASSISANAVITSTTSTATTADAAFSASVAGDYALRVTSLGDPAQEATINLRVHQVYSAMDAYSQRVTFFAGRRHYSQRNKRRTFGYLQCHCARVSMGCRR